MPQPDANLGVGSGSHAEQTAAVMIGVERDLRRASGRRSCSSPATSTRRWPRRWRRPSCDVPVAHVESGLRSRDWAMPEEVNRVVTDRVSDLLLCTSEDAVENLAAEGIAGDGVSWSATR